MTMSRRLKCITVVATVLIAPIVLAVADIAAVLLRDLARHVAAR